MNANAIVIKEATHNDKSQIAEVLLDFYNMSDLNEAINAFLSELEKDFHYIVAVENGKIIGLVTWFMHGLPKHGLFELDRICILSASRGKGVGIMLVDRLVDDARKWYNKLDEDIRKLYLLTHEDNKNAHAFYEKIGFEHETTLKDHYYDNKDERVYSMFFIDN
ncbi:MAG: GNAT family N-acetyltransferase [Candidatus Neomarinimicrobiota bacterium]|jgi:ribosomal protein S18 acetylase RimI-like enzyme|nr:GNAT family N-acetyltransferase [Candidatus Neomarinimicrobiota bacterium]|tara:strand:+ start:42 stop:533 length:492 start_codon:yes stop_codon:yes gene_type:complete